MGGSGGGGGGFPPSSDTIQRKIEQAREAEKQRLDQDVDQLLQRFLAQVNDRDADATKEHLDAVTEALEGVADVETLLFGGSVAKHTFVDGLSDVDALVILERAGTQGILPQKLLADMERQISNVLRRADVESVVRGSLAVTVRFGDGTELQLLPAVRSGSTINIPDSSGAGWNATNPKKFQRQLTSENKRLNRALIPTVKLVKSLVGDLPEQQRLSGYHTEALCVDASRSFRGEAKPRELLTHVLDHAARRVMKPMRDVTGQERVVDGYLGAANSPERRLVSQAIAGIKRRLEAATSINQWRAMFGSKGE